MHSDGGGMKGFLLGFIALLVTASGLSQELAPNVTFMGPDGEMIQGIRCATVDNAPPDVPRAPENMQQWLEENHHIISGTVNIPVAFHVITALNGTGNVPDEQIQEQIDTLNAAFEGTGFAFYLASTDRTANDNWFYNTAAFDAQMKAALAIDPPHNLNVYSANIGGGILGYAYLPWQWPETSTNHGVVVLYSSLPGGSAFPYNLGATATHEVGHYLGLYHTFENGCNSPGDEVDDTPYEASPAFGCPAARNTCSDPELDPVHNYMDYTDDACMYELTQGQADRMDWAVNTFKPGLLEAAAVPDPISSLAAYSDYTTPTSIELSWTDPTNLVNGDTLLVGSFQIFIERDGEALDSVASGGMQYLDAGLTEGLAYTYDLYARLNGSTLNGATASVTWTAGGAAVPGTPVNFTLSGNDQEVTLQWTNPATNSDGTPMIDFGGINLYQNDMLVATYARSTTDTAANESVVSTPPVPGFYEWYLTAFDTELPPRESIPTSTMVTPLNIPFSDQFTTPGPPNPSTWITGNADVNDRADTPPSSPYALNLNAMPTGRDTAEMRPLDLNGLEESGVVFVYSYQPQGTGNAPELGDSLTLYFRNDLGGWIKVLAYAGASVRPFERKVITIAHAPNSGGSFFHSQFQVRFTSEGSPAVTPVDDWFVDDVSLLLPDIASSQDTIVFDTTLVGSVGADSIAITNRGATDLTISGIVSTNPVFMTDADGFALLSGESRSIGVDFAPSSAGAFTGMLMIASSDPWVDTLIVELAGVGDLSVDSPNRKGLPGVFSLGPNYPNPFNPSTTITYDLPVKSSVDLVIYDLLGSKIRTLVAGSHEAGSHTVHWDGTNETGVPVTTGVYVYRFTAGDYRMVRKMLLLK